MLKFTRGNAKLDALESVVGGQVWTFSLLSGYSCPYAKQCLSKAVRGSDGKTTIVDGPDTLFRCFSASEEAMYPNVYNSRNDNFQQLRSIKNHWDMVQHIHNAIPVNAKCIRVHVGGDFFSQAYFDAWMDVAKIYPHVLFYAYTKSLPFWLKSWDKVPNNFSITASFGGRYDDMIESCSLKHAIVISDPQTCQDVIDSGQSDKVVSGKFKGYPIDHDDRHSALPEFRNQSFALLIHGTQPKNSEASKAKSVLNGIGSYSK